MKNRRVFRCIFWLVAMAVILLPAAMALARAGGGEGYSGGGDDGGGGGGGGGGDGGAGVIWLVFQLIRLCFVYPAIGIPLLIIIVVVFFLASRSGTSAYQSSVIRRGGEVMDQYSRSAAVSELQQHDPSFNEASFCTRVNGAFVKIQNAWCAQDLTTVRTFISDAVAERFALQFAEQKDEGYRDHMEQISVQSVQIADVHCAGVFDEMAVRIAASAADYRVSISDGRRTSATGASGSGSVESFVEIWSFLRRRGAVTDISRGGLMEGHCPNCGAAVTMNESTQCPQCKSLLLSGQYDWVLTEITQECEWDPNLRHQVANLESFRESDPDFDPQTLEDRASVIFWRKASADRLGKIDPIRKVATEEFCTAYGQALHAADRAYVGHCAVGGVTTLGILPGDGGQLDRALVQVRYSGNKMTHASGERSQVLDGNIVRTALYVLGRKHGAKTDADKSITSSHCPNCGAPESSSASNACEFCGTVLNDGSRGWVLLSVQGLSQPGAQAMLSQIRGGGNGEISQPPLPILGAAAPVPGHGSSAGLLAWAVKMATADGTVDDQERSLLSNFAESGGVPAEQLDAMIAAAQNGNLEVPQPADATEGRAWLTAMAEMAVADGKLDSQEYALLQTMGDKVGLSDYDVKMLINRVQSQTLSAAGDALRSAKSGQPMPPPPLSGRRESDDSLIQKL